MAQNKRNTLTNFLIKGFKDINEITDNIDLIETSFQYVKNQLPDELNKSFLQIKYSESDEETFFQFLKKNDKFFANIKIKTVGGNEETLKDHLDNYFKHNHSKYNQDKLFYFYFQLILMELFLNKNNKELPRKDLKQKLEDVLKNHCRPKKHALKECLGKNINEIDVVTMSELDLKIQNKCKIQKEELEQCVRDNL